MNILPFFVIVPLAAAFLISLLGKKIKAIPDILGSLGALILLLLSLYSVKLVNIHETLVYKVGGW
ncbi:MAG: hypothetical protein KJ793_02320, partial [Candidatus Omnitrophica bacterium]|nr:hypothetical protein [Candidatus Omnitrophota bacterium]